MTEPREHVEPAEDEPDVVRRTSEGKDPATPFLALGGVTLVVAVVAGIFIAALVTLWWVLAR